MNSPPPSTCEVCGTGLPPSAHTTGLCPRCLVKSGAFGRPAGMAPGSGVEPTDPLVSGQRVGGGRFSLVDLLGEGGMGVVWLAMDEELSRGGAAVFVALKFLAPRIRSDPQALTMLREEVLQSRRLRHPRIVSIYDWHALPDEPTFISMEYVEGVNLSQLLSLQPNSLMVWPALAPWVKQLCDALEYAHCEERIIHRDLKPANMMLNQRSELKLADFGLARGFVESDEEDPRQTQVRGTPLYMSPQQMMGRPPHPTDDIYSLGATLYELLTGTPPFYTGGNIFQQVLNDPPEPIHDRLAQLGYENEVPARVRMTIAACLQKDAASRPQSAREAAHRLGLALLEGPKPSHQPYVPATRIEEEGPPPRQPSSVGTTVIILALLLAVAGYLFRDTAPMRAVLGRTSKPGGEEPSRTGRPGDGLPNRGALSVRTEPGDTLLELAFANGRPARSAQLRGTDSAVFDNLPAGSYRLSVSKDGYEPTSLAIEIKRGGPWPAFVRLPPVPQTGGPTNTLTLTSAASLPVSFRLWDEQRRKIIREETLVRRSTNQEGIAAGSYYLEAGLGEPETATVRMNERLQIQPGDNQAEISFAPGKVHFLVDQEAEVTALDQWGGRKTLSLSPWLEEGRKKGFHGWHERVLPGEYAYSFSLPPRFEEQRTNIVVAPGAAREFGIGMTPCLSATPGFRWTNSLGMEFIWFDRPSPGFWGCATETTRRQYGVFAAATGQSPPELVSVTPGGWRRRGDTWQRPGFDQQEGEPVVGVSWDDAMRFCVWLAQRERHLLRGNQSYTLPSDEQWSVMAGSAPFPWGDQWPPGNDVVNCAGIEARATNWYAYWPTLAAPEHQDLWTRTAPVLAAKPNARGLYHLGGNVAEWCLDWYRKAMNEPALRQRYPLLEQDGGGETYRVLRGGSWYDHHPDDLGTLTRARARPDERHDRYGFRAVLVQESPEGH